MGYSSICYWWHTYHSAAVLSLWSLQWMEWVVLAIVAGILALLPVSRQCRWNDMSSLLWLSISSGLWEQCTYCNRLFLHDASCRQPSWDVWQLYVAERINTTNAWCTYTLIASYHWVALKITDHDWDKFNKWKQHTINTQSTHRLITSVATLHQNISICIKLVGSILALFCGTCWVKRVRCLTVY